MPKWILLYSRVAVLAFYFGHWTAVLEPRAARADDTPPTAASELDESAGRHPFPPRGTSATKSGESSGRPGGWWLGTVGIALALAVVGGLSIVSRRFAPAAQTGTMALRVIGRTSLSPKHAVYLLRAGDRVLVLGTGPQGPPALLGELEDDPAHGSARPNPDQRGDA